MTDAPDESAEGTVREAADDGAGDAGDLVVCKLGGSVVTDKERPETVDDDALAAAADAVAVAAREGPTDRLVLVHGGGSFGHHHAAAHGVTETEGTRDAAAVLSVHRAMVDLNDAVVDALRDRGVPAVPVHPLSAGSRDAEGTLALATDQVARLRDEGFLPVLHGDVVAHEGTGVTVLSGDELVVALAEGLGADRVGVCSTVPGVLDEAGDVVDRIDGMDDVRDVLGASDATDVTGGMAGKVRRLLDLGVPAQIFGPDALAAFLAGETVGTTVDGRRAESGNSD